MTEFVEKGLKKVGVIFGILAMALEPVLRFVVGIFFIIEGVLLLTEYLELRKQQPTPSPAQA